VITITAVIGHRILNLIQSFRDWRSRYARDADPECALYIYPTSRDLFAVATPWSTWRYLLECRL
jgi:putative SOS response-associated peptidase YedK